MEISKVLSVICNGNFPDFVCGFGFVQRSGYTSGLVVVWRYSILLIHNIYSV